MPSRFFAKFDIVAFVANIIAVILGIIITFSIQGLIDRKDEKENINSALQLVMDELKDCRSYLQTCSDVMDLESKAAAYILNHSDNLHACPPDSVSTYGITVISEMVLTMPSDALELLKTSSLFQAIGDNILSLKILRAYDQCQALQQIFMMRENMKSDLFNMACKSDLLGVNKGDGDYISIQQLCKDKQGKIMLIRLKVSETPALQTGVKDIDAAIDAIGQYLSEH